MTIIVTGGCGYKGSVLTQKLLELGHLVYVIDTQWFGCHLDHHPNLIIIRDDIRTIKTLPQADVIFHLAAVANDPSCELDSKLAWETNVLGTYNLLELCKKNHILRFIYSSSGSVYGISEELEVHENLPLIPISDYNKTKMIAERIILSYKEFINYTIFRPATVCGMSPRQRYDLAVNALAISAKDNQLIEVNGGSQMRPNVHIKDIVDAYIWCIDQVETYGEIFNIGFKNLTLSEIATTVQDIIPCKVVYKDSLDPRSYRLCSKKLLNLGFKPKYNIDDAIKEIRDNFTRCYDINYNVKWMNKCGIK